MQPEQVPEVSATEAYALVERGEAVLLDVREDHEWVEAHAPMAVSAPMSRLRADLAGIPADRRIVCVCAVGGRSAAVTEALRRAGRDAVNLAGGMHAWLAAGLPVVTGG